MERVNITSGEAIKILRGWNKITRMELSQKSGINVNNLSLIENDKISIGKKRAIALGGALQVHPALILFPNLEDRGK